MRLGNPHALLATLGKGELPPLDVALSIAEGVRHAEPRGVGARAARDGRRSGLGSDALSLSLSLDKAWAHGLVAAAGVPVPRSARRSAPSATCATRGDWRFPLFVKPRWEGTAKGIGPHSRVDDARRARARGRAHRARLRSARARRAFPARGRVHGGAWSGTRRRARCPVLQRALEPTTGIGVHALERHPAPPGGWRSHTPGALDAALERELARLALRAFEALECRDFARADFKLDAAGRPRFLEINPLPTFAPDGSFAILAELAGREPTRLPRGVLGEGLRRLGLS